MNDRRCDKCEFWEKTGFDSRPCRVNPPRCVDGFVGCWPLTLATGWCGEFEPVQKYRAFTGTITSQIGDDITIRSDDQLLPPPNGTRLEIRVVDAENPA